MINVLYAVVVLGALAIVFGAVLAVAAKKFAVECDARQEAILGVLPGANCGGCGFPGCSGYAAAVVEGRGPPPTAAPPAAAKLPLRLPGSWAWRPRIPSGAWRW